MFRYSLLLMSVFFYSIHAESYHDLKMDFYYGYATSDNLAQNKIEKINGNFSNIETNVIGKTLLHNRHYLLYRGGFKTKRHTSDLHADNFDENLGTIELGNQIRVGKSHILGLQAHYLNFSGRTIDFQTNSTEGRDSQFGEIGSALIWQNSAMLFGQYLDFTLKTFYLERDFKTLANDENGNLFEDDYSAKGIQLKNEFQLTNRLLIQITPEYKIKTYSDRRSRFTEGTLDNSKRNPFQELAIWSLTNRIEYVSDFAKIFALHNFVFQDDKAFGALDYDGNIYSFGIELPFTSIAVFRPIFTTGKHQYETFVANVISDPQSTEKRVDKITSWEIPIEISLPLVKLVLNYQNQKISSNYPLEGFNVEKYEIGIKYEL